jgi:glyoxylase-like metal-dependent hydrolase (beta-lactamase superfamily II)
MSGGDGNSRPDEAQPLRFLYEPEPARGQTVQVALDVWRAVATNPGKMTYHGTNTYFLTTSEGMFVLDPGPGEDEDHLNLILRLAGAKLAGIVVSHHHSDHFGLVPRLKAMTGAPVYAFRRFADDTFVPDILLDDGDRLADYEVLHTPGHASDHLCFARDDGLVLTGDHAMTWNSSIVSPPDGNMADYVAQLQRLVDRGDQLYLPGHGPPMSDPVPYVSRLLANRQLREQKILNAVRAGRGSVEVLAERLYRKSDPWLARAARRNVEAHLLKLEKEGRVRRSAEGGWEVTG